MTKEEIAEALGLIEKKRKTILPEAEKMELIEAAKAFIEPNPWKPFDWVQPKVNSWFKGVNQPHLVIEAGVLDLSSNGLQVSDGSQSNGLINNTRVLCLSDSGAVIQFVLPHWCLERFEFEEERTGESRAPERRATAAPAARPRSREGEARTGVSENSAPAEIKQ